MALKQVTKLDTVPLRGGTVTVREPALLPFGAFSMMQNIRQRHPGVIKRPGQRVLHTTADGTNKVMSLYQFRKSEVDESHLFAQMSDGDILEATSAPPGITNGVFGSEVYDGASGQIPASWAAINDILVHSNGVNQHQVYGGNASYVEKFIVYKGGVTPPNIPEIGEDYSVEIGDGSSTTAAILDNLNTFANHHCWFTMTPTPANSFRYVIKCPNANAATLAPYYRKNDNTWAAAAGSSDGTKVGGDTTLGQTGTVAFTSPTDQIPNYMFGRVGYWIQWRVGGASLDLEVEVSSVTFSGPWSALSNIWDGVPVDPVEVWVAKEAVGRWSVNAAGAVDLDTLASGRKILIFCTDPIEGIYIDVGSTPNASGTTLTSVKYWYGAAMGTIGTTVDGTSGMLNSGWITFPRQEDVQPVQYESSMYYAYVYEVIWDSALAADMVVGFQVMPYFDTSDFGKAGYSCCAWKDRMCYSFDRYGAYVYIGAQGSPSVLNGSNYGLLKAGDGRNNKVVGMARFHNELLVGQEELGVEGGCITLFEGYTPGTYGKLLLSSRVGLMNAKSLAVVDGVMTATATDEQLKTLGFGLSRYGIWATDGRTVSIISDDIGNYFDPSRSECVRRGYEQEMWLKHDTRFNVLRVGLVSGSSATVPNVFPVFDLVDKSWSFDSMGQALSCVEEVEAGSGNTEIVQVGGGTGDGTVYQLNYGQNDVAVAIDSYVDMELCAKGHYMDLLDIVVRCKTQSAGDILLSVDANEVNKISSLALSMVAEVASQGIRRHAVSVNIVDQHLTVRLRHATASQDMYLLDMGMGVKLWDSRR